MDHLILTKTEFFRLITDEKDISKLPVAYQGFIDEISNLYISYNNRNELLFVMAYTEVELQCLYECYRQDVDKNKESEACFQYVRKTLSFIRRTLSHIQSQVSQPTVNASKNQTSASPNFRWTGSVVELVEIIYGFMEMRSINNGEMPITELASFISSQFGVEIKDCYSAYVDMKRRKNNSRTYYLDKMRERLNRRMELDDERG